MLDFLTCKDMLLVCFMCYIYCMMMVLLMNTFDFIHEPLKSIVSLLLLPVVRCLYIFTAHTECVNYLGMRKWLNG